MCSVNKILTSYMKSFQMIMQENTILKFKNVTTIMPAVPLKISYQFLNTCTNVMLLRRAAVRSTLE